MTGTHPHEFRVARPDRDQRNMALPSRAGATPRPPIAPDAARRWRVRLRTRWGRWLLAAGWLLMPCPARADFHESFESGETAWRVADADCGYRIGAHQRTSQTAYSGRGCEALQVVAGPGTFLHYVYEIPRARVIAEWSPTVWVKADRPGLQFMARVVLPRSADPRTGAPLMALLRGDLYERVGSWQQLAIRQADQLLNRQVRVLRSQFGADIDAREAFVDLVVLNVYGGAGVTNLWIDDLEIVGQVPQVSYGTPAADAAPAGAAGPGPVGGLGGQRAAIRLQGSVLLGAGRPLFPRVVESNGEPLEWLQSLGFNTVRLSAPATPIQLREAARLGLWLVAPPPPDAVITADHDPILAWDLGSRLTEDRLELTRQWSGQLRRADLQAERPLICSAEQRLWAYSRLTNLLLVPALPLGGGMSPAEYGAWFRQRAGLARPGTPLWAAIPTEPDAAVMEQWSALALEPPLSLVAEADQVTLLTYQALASGARGLLYTSRSPLDRSDADTQLRARTLRRLNLELQLLEPWVAGGASVTEIDAGAADLRMVALQTERASLLIVIAQAPGQQFTVGPVPERTLSLIVPSVVNAPQVYRVTAAGLRTLTHRRVAGGVRLTLEEPGLVSLVALTQDPLVLGHLTRVVSSTQGEVVRLQYELASAGLQLVEQVHARVVGELPETPVVTQWLSQARAHLRHCELLLAASDWSAAATYAERTANGLRQVRRHDSDQAARSFPTPVSSPYCVSFATLPSHWEMAVRLQSAPQWESPPLPAGDCDNLDHLRATGWRNESTREGTLQTLVEVSPENPHGGRAALRLQAWSPDGPDRPPLLESPPIQIRSAPVRVRRGQLVQIRGWVRMPNRGPTSGDGLLVYDSLAGPALGERIPVTEGWREFVLYRAAPGGTDVCLIVALTGCGEAWLDDVSITLHEPIGQRDPQDQFDQARHLPPVGETLR